MARSMSILSANKTPRIKKDLAICKVFLVLVIGVEPIRYFYRGILSPLRLPIPPYQQKIKRKATFPAALRLFWRHHPDSDWG